MKRNKLYIILAILTTVFLFTTSAICNQCVAATEEEKVDVGEKEEAVATEEEAATEEEVTEEEEAVATEEEAATEEEVTEEEEEAVVEEKEAPTIELEIYEGPTYSAGDDVCYYRVKATVTGKPAPTVSFSKDDSGGAWGSKKVQINLTRDHPSYTLTATAKNSVGVVTDSIVLNWGCGPLPVEKTIVISPSILGTISTASATYAYVAIGNSPTNLDLRGRFAFNVSSLAGKEIVDAELKLSTPDITIPPCTGKGDIVILYNDFLPDITFDDYFIGGAIALAGQFTNDVDPLVVSTDFLKTKIAERALAGTALQFGIGYWNPLPGASLPEEERLYQTNDITLTITYKE